VDTFECPMCQPKCLVIICYDYSIHIKKCIYCYKPTNPIKLTVFDRLQKKNGENKMIMKINENMVALEKKNKIWQN